MEKSIFIGSEQASECVSRGCLCPGSAALSGRRQTQIQVVARQTRRAHRQTGAATGTVCTLACRRALIIADPCFAHASGRLGYMSRVLGGLLGMR